MQQARSLRRALVRTLGASSVAYPVARVLARSPLAPAHSPEVVRDFAIVSGESSLGFRYQAAGFGELSALFKRCQGTIRLTQIPAGQGEQAGLTADVEVLIAVDSVDTGNALLDRIVRGASLFDSARFPQALFTVRRNRLPATLIRLLGYQGASESTGGAPSLPALAASRSTASTTPGSAPLVVLDGLLRIRDQEHKTALALTSLAITQLPLSGNATDRGSGSSAQRLQAVAQTHISRSTFGVSGFAALVRDTIAIDLGIVARSTP